MEVKGIPPDNIIDKSLKKKVYFEGYSPKIVANSRGKRRVPGSKPLENILKNIDSRFLDFINSK